MKKLWFILAIFLISEGTAFAGPFEDAVAYLDQGDFATAAVLFQQLAEQGDAKSQYVTGYIYEYGKGVAINEVEALRWYRLAVDQNLDAAQYILGMLYEDGKIVERDFAEAARLYQLAADQGDRMAWNAMGFMYLRGRGVEHSTLHAAMWFMLAAGEGDTIASDELGEIAQISSNRSLMQQAQTMSQQWMMDLPENVRSRIMARYRGSCEIASSVPDCAALQ